MMLTTKKAIGALQIKRVVGFGSYTTASYLCRRIRAPLQDQQFKELMDIDEVDEACVARKVMNKHRHVDHLVDYDRSV